MDEVYVFFIRNDVWIYILCGLGLLWYGSEFFRGRAILRQAMFGLERETGRRVRNTAVTLVVILVGLVSWVVYVNVLVGPTLPAGLLRPPTPTPNPFSLPIVTSGSVEVEATATLPMAPTVTLPGQATVTPTITPPIQPPTPTPFVAGCSPTVIITNPAGGTILAGEITFLGSASIANFAFYELEIHGPQTSGLWASLLGRRMTQPVVESKLGEADLSGWSAGSYQLRLSVTDQSGNLTNQCVIEMELTNAGGG